MKNVTLMSGTQNHLAIKNSKHHVELHDAGMTAVKVGWSKFPTQTSWTKAGGTEEEYASILSACNALYKSLKNSDRASERLSSVWSCADAEIINNEDPQILQAIQNLGGEPSSENFLLNFLTPSQQSLFKQFQKQE